MVVSKQGYTNPIRNVITPPSKVLDYSDKNEKGNVYLKDKV